MEYELIRNYKMNNPKITKEKNIFYIMNDGKKYIAKKISIDSMRLLETIYLDDSYYQLVKNNFGNYITKIKDSYYILFYINNFENINEKEVFQKNNVYQKLIIDWEVAWNNKIDYFEKILRNKKEVIINETKDYFLGLSETSVNLLRINKEKINKTPSICRKRINLKIFRFPDNSVIDTKERDIGEYIKYLIFEKKSDYQEVKEFVNKLEEFNYNYYLIAARVLFPTYYYDAIERATNEKELNDSIKLIIEKSKIVEKIANYILEDYLGISIGWIKKQE